MRFIKDLKEDDLLIEHYLCKEKQTLKSRNGKTYFSLTLQDKTGTINGKVWDLNKDIQSFDANDFIKIDALVTSYQNDLQLKIGKIRRSNEGEYDPVDYIPVSDKNVDNLYDDLIALIKTIENPKVEELLHNIFVNDKEIAECIKTHSAAKAMHHSYMGGLIEHTVSVAEICDFMSKKYKSVNRDILIAGAMLHDVGKIKELSGFPENEYTDVGQLLGHLIIGVELVTREADKIDKFPQDYKNLIKHMIVAHHGELQYGSPKKPATVEAFILHLADNMDARVKMYENSIENDTTGGRWVGYNRMLETNIRRTDNLG